jgi:hypothetical protein
MSAIGTRAMVTDSNFDLMQQQTTSFFPYTPTQSATTTQTQLQQMSPTQRKMEPSTQQQERQHGTQPQPGTLISTSHHYSLEQQHLYKPTIPAPQQQQQGEKEGQETQQIANRQQRISQPTTPNSHQNLPSAPSPPIRSVNQSLAQENLYGNLMLPQCYDIGQTDSRPAFIPSFDLDSQFYRPSDIDLLSPSSPVEAQRMSRFGAFHPSNPTTQHYNNQARGNSIPYSNLNYHYNPNLFPSDKPNQASATTMSQMLSQFPLPCGHHNPVNNRNLSPYSFTPASISENDHMCTSDFSERRIFGDEAQHAVECFQFKDADADDGCSSAAT